MDVFLLLQSFIVIVETVFLCGMIYYIIRGIKTKNYGYAILFFGLYLVANIVRRISGL